MKRNPVRGVVLDPARESLVSSAGGVLVRQAIRLSLGSTDVVLSPCRVA